VLCESAYKFSQHNRVSNCAVHKAKQHQTSQPFLRAGQKQILGFSPTFYGTRRLIPAFKKPDSYPYSEPAQSMTLSNFLKIHFNIILSSKRGSFTQVSPPKPCMPLCSTPYMLHVPRISFFLFDYPNNIRRWDCLLPFGAESSVFCLLSSSLLSKNIKIKIHSTINMSIVLYGCETWSLTLREERRLRVFEKRVLRRIFRPKRDEVTM
jgi:hypothetical protein